MTPRRALSLVLALGAGIAVAVALACTGRTTGATPGSIPCGDAACDPGFDCFEPSGLQEFGLCLPVCVSSSECADAGYFFGGAAQASCCSQLRNTHGGSTFACFPADPVYDHCECATNADCPSDATPGARNGCCQTPRGDERAFCQAPPDDAACP